MASLAGGGSGCEEAEATAADWRLHHPARLELIGPSGCGKSETMLKLAADDSVWTLEEEDGRSGPVFRDLIYCAPSLDDREDFLRRLSLVAERGGKRLRCHQDLLDAESIKAWSGGRPVLYLVDDMPSLSDCSGLNSLVSMDSRHLGISCVFAMQTPFIKRRGLDMPFFTRNMTGRFIFYQRADYRLYTTLNARLFPDKKNWLLGCLNYAREKLGSNYIYIDNHPRPKLPRRFMTMTNIFSGERGADGSPVFFDMHKMVV